MPRPRRFLSQALYAASLPCFMLAAASEVVAQRALVAAGQDAEDCELRQYQLQAAGWTSSVLRAHVKLLAPATTNELADDWSETNRARRMTRNGVVRIEGRAGAKVLLFENLDLQEFGILHVDGAGLGRVVYAGPDAIDAPLSIAADERHLVFARNQQLIIVRLDGAQFASTGASWRTVTLPDNVVQESVTAAAQCAFCVLDDGTVWRTAYSDAAVATNLTPAVTFGSEQALTMAVSGDGSTVAFLRGPSAAARYVWVARATGAATRLAGPPRAYRAPDYAPGAGLAWLVLSEDGGRLMATEAGSLEDELHVFDTWVNATGHLTGAGLFADYIGAHVLPGFYGGDLVFASGHLGQFDWYRVQASGTIVNLTQTGTPEPPFFVGSLAVQQRLPIGVDGLLAVDGDGGLSTARLLSAAGVSTALYDDLTMPPQPGAAATDMPDVLVRGLGGDRLVSGLDGSVVLALPAGLQLEPGVRSGDGWRVTFVSLAGGIGVLAMLLPDGSIQVGPLSFAPPGFGLDDAGRLTVLDGATLRVFGPGLNAATTLANNPWRCLLSGAGN